MFSRKKWIAVGLTWILMLSRTCPAYGEGQQISSVSIRITSDIEAGRAGGKAEAAAGDSRYSVTDCHIADPPQGRWEEGIRPLVSITVEAEGENYFKNNFSKSDVFLKGTDALVSSVNRNGSALIILVVLDVLDKGENSLEQESGPFRGDPAAAGFSRGSGNSSAGGQRSPYGISDVLKDREQSNNGTWVKDEEGWWYCNEDQGYTVSSWQYINNRWYYFNEQGYMMTGWVVWLDKYYYCGPDGMWTDRWTPDGYYVDESGVWIQGKVKDSGPDQAE